LWRNAQKRKTNALIEQGRFGRLPTRRDQDYPWGQPQPTRLATMLKRQRGAQPHNRNAVKTGYHTAEAKAARKAAFEAVLAERKEQERRSDEWCKAQPGYLIDYDSIIQGLIKLQREREEEERR
jgi:hypothetical protein